ncbi:contact-dependent growth inhibition system immunity protein [Chitinophaga filiformis]|uniref:Uncharacterized protein n=1 Tax=Chitinophaga filiformis TaxID=104663 RepID=A0A1G7J1Q0_CHIFI|nr:contact-dependent growth inhibition system immunity protein [Chitinophaga filiformis]SDF18796.1 hypothetical protein SAMN04488121_1011068 [Chitinophaga filiformis]
MISTKSIEQLENDYWKDIEFPTGLVERCYRYRRIPIGNLTPGQIRTLISQQIGLTFLMPLALEMLRKDVLIETELYEGDLLSAVLTADISFWKQYPAIKSEVFQLIEAKKQSLVLDQSEDAKYINKLLEKISSSV